MTAQRVFRVVVTGGAGFIGSHLTRRLLDFGYKVTVVDDLSTGKRSNIPSDVTFIEGSILDEDVLRASLYEADACVHLAAIASVARCNQELLYSHQVNSTGLLNIIHKISEKPTPIPLIFASSAAVYGGSQNLPLREDERCSPLSPYGADKLSCELHARAALEVYRIPSIGLRFFNVYGPGQDPTSPYSGVITKFIERARNGQVLNIYGDGHQTRDFVYVGDIVESIVHAVTNCTDGNTIVNVCTGIETKVIDLARMILEQINPVGQVVHTEAPPGEVMHSIGSPEKLLEVLHYQCNTSLPEGLQDLLRSWGIVGEGEILTS